MFHPYNGADTRRTKVHSVVHHLQNAALSSLSGQQEPVLWQDSWTPPHPT